MDFLAIALLAAATLGLCFGLDKLFTKVFRSRSQHKSGLQVRLNKRYGSMGLIVLVLGVAALLGARGQTLLLICGVLLIPLGIGLVVYYMTFGVFYDDDGFVLTTFGKKSRFYAYSQIKGQQLYTVYATTVVELHLEGGKAFQLQSTMTGVYPFLDKAFGCWCRQKGVKESDCGFHDPEKSCWFPPVEGV